MASEGPVKSIKEKAADEMRELAVVFAYLAFFFCTLTTYSMMLLGNYQNASFHYGSALVKALLISKVILIGDAVHLGRRQESRPLMISSVRKAFLYTLLVFAFHIIEELVVRAVHGKHLIGTFHDIRLADVIARSIVAFCMFIPFFAFRELSRVLGKEQFRSVFFGKGAAPT